MLGYSPRSCMGKLGLKNRVRASRLSSSSPSLDNLVFPFFTRIRYVLVFTYVWRRHKCVITTIYLFCYDCCCPFLSPPRQQVFDSYLLRSRVYCRLYVHATNYICGVYPCNLSSMTIHSCMIKVWLNHRFTAIAFVFYSNNAANNYIRQN